MMRRSSILWIAALVTFAIGTVLLLQASRLRSEMATDALGVNALRAETQRLTQRPNAPVSLSSLTQRFGLNPTIEVKGKRTTLGFDQASMNAIIQFVFDAERIHGYRIVRLSLSVPSPGLATGLAEIEPR